jgi:hypothetical protein
MKSRERILDELVLEAASNDFESFQCILDQVTKWFDEKGLATSRQEVLDALQRMIREGYALAYLLSSQEPHSETVEFLPDRLDDFWFYVTPKGRELVINLHD